MKVIVFGATGMIGQGVLRECLLSDRVTQVLVIGRASTGLSHPKLREVRHGDFGDLTAVAGELAGHDACFFCLGVSSAGRSEEDYRLVTHTYAVAAARAVAEAAPGAAFVLLSGEGADSSEKGRVMWARVKGAAENAVFALPVRGYAFRPGYVQPLHGARSRTGWYRAFYAVLRPLYPLLRRVGGRHVTTTEAVGRAMVSVAADGWPDRVLGSDRINEAAARLS